MQSADCHAKAWKFHNPLVVNMVSEVMQVPYQRVNATVAVKIQMKIQMPDLTSHARCELGCDPGSQACLVFLGIPSSGLFGLEFSLFQLFVSPHTLHFVASPCPSVLVVRSGGLGGVLSCSPSEVNLFLGPPIVCILRSAGTQFLSMEACFYKKTKTSRARQRANFS